ncbi:hypothetical protein B0H16DRAFT_1670180 [Mycena metata]|uniref:Uncharacterized protein n=1 Tax=Mycena metata TaxID=1033252 RepID=A0AAD7P359_9AGAR|nr:hypothetical protein B0H16DRAFT_1670180 [Mycena metata]
MRAKQIWDVLPLPSKAKLVWERCTFSKLTTGYVLFSLIHFALQISLQINAFTINANAATLLYSIALQGNATNSSFPTLAKDTHGVDNIRMCATVPKNLNTDNCTVVWDGVPTNNNTLFGTPPAGSYYADAANTSPLLTFSSVPASSAASSVASAVSISSASSAVSASASPSAVTLVFVTEIVTAPTSSKALPTSSAAKPSSAVAPVRRAGIPSAKVFSLSNQTVQVNITGLSFHEYPLVLDRSCMWSLNWPISVLDNTKREDIVFIAFQFWVLGMSLVALLNESIPHIIASLLTHALATGWSGFQLFNTATFKKQFEEYITKGACAGPNVPSLLPNYWSQRAAAEIPTLALNVAALFISCILTWKLVKLFGWQTFKRVGASLTINRVYKLVLVLSITLQVSMFFMAVTVSLFLDQLFNGYIGRLAWYSMVYKIGFVITGVLLPAWLMIGWFAVRREMRLGMIVFLGLSVLYLAGWGVMFLSTTFRWTFRTWNFFNIMATLSVILTLLSFALGVICRLNFGKGLLRYLNAQESLPGDDFVPITRGGDDMEKVAFPSNEKPVPTYSATFGSGSEVPVPSQMFRPSPQLGPRFFNSSAEPFESRSNSSNNSPISPPMAALTRTSSKESYQSAATAMPNKRDSGRSLGSLNSYYDYSADNSRHTRQDSTSTSNTIGNAKRWVIDD